MAKRRDRGAHGRAEVLRVRAQLLPHEGVERAAPGSSGSRRRSRVACSVESPFCLKMRRSRRPPPPAPPRSRAPPSPPGAGGDRAGSRPSCTRPPPSRRPPRAGPANPVTTTVRGLDARARHPQDEREVRDEAVVHAEIAARMRAGPAAAAVPALALGDERARADGRRARIPRAPAGAPAPRPRWPSPRHPGRRTCRRRRLRLEHHGHDRGRSQPPRQPDQRLQTRRAGRSVGSATPSPGACGPDVACRRSAVAEPRGRSGPRSAPLAVPASPS